MANATALFGVVPEHREDSIESAQVTCVFWLLFWLLARSLFTCVFWLLFWLLARSLFTCVFWLLFWLLARSLFTCVFWLLFWLLARSLFTCVCWSPLVYLHSHEIPFKSPQLLNRDTFQLLTQMPFNFPFSV